MVSGRLGAFEFLSGLAIGLKVFLNTLQCIRHEKSKGADI
jgi:hypothetical protein